MSKHIDQFDYKIISSLLKDGRMPFSTIAKDLGITDVAVKKRFERMQSRGIIKKVMIDLDYKALGLKGMVQVLLKVDPIAVDKAVLTLKEDDFLQSIFKIIGDYNIVFFYLIKDIDNLNNLNKLLSKLNGLLDFKMLFVDEKAYEKQNIPITSLQVYYK
jgi:Lrp/AsnC family transcriptional regulator, regulator for asnA, asnC and gidA